MIERLLHKAIVKNLFKGKVILLLGPRQVGKTTLLHLVAEKYPQKSLWLNADETIIREKLSKPNTAKLKRLAGKNKIIFIDEAHRVENIGLTLKIFADTIKNVQVVATGSSAFELSDKIKEPLTGRKFEFHLFPFSVEELVNHFSEIEEEKNMENRLIYGSYPEVINNPGNEINTLVNISDSFLYKDLFALEKVKKPALLEKLLQALALQVGQEVSFNELGQMLGADKETIERYMFLLEQTFVIFRLPAFSRNVRNELKKSRKIYFYDNGIRNSLISNFSPLALRQDKGQLWENYLVSERQKYLHYHQVHCNRYFWRTTQQQEIDYIEEKNGILYAFEFKYSPKQKAKLPGTFSSAYPKTRFSVVNSENYLDFFVT